MAPATFVFASLKLGGDYSPSYSAPPSSSSLSPPFLPAAVTEFELANRLEPLLALAKRLPVVGALLKSPPVGAPPNKEPVGLLPKREPFVGGALPKSEPLPSAGTPKSVLPPGIAPNSEGAGYFFSSAFYSTLFPANVPPDVALNRG